MARFLEASIPPIQISKEEIDSTKIHNRLIEHVNQLLTNIEENQTFSESFKELSNVCQILITENRYSVSFVFDILMIILKDYIKLLDNDRFIQAIKDDKANHNTNFLRQFFRVIRLKYIEQPENLNNLSSKTRRKMFFSLFDQLNSSKSLILYLQHKLPDDNKVFRISCNFILYTVLIVSKDLNAILTSTDLERYENNLFNLFIIFIDEYFIRKENLRLNDLFIQELLSFLFDLTARPLAIPIFLKGNYPQLCLRWLSLSYLNTFEYSIIIDIIQNITWHDEGINELKKFNCVKILRDFQNEQLTKKTDFIIDEHWVQRINRVLDLIFASTIEPEEFPHEDINQLLLIAKTCSKPPHYNSETCHIKQILIPLTKLCTNDEILDYIFEENSNRMFIFTTLKSLLFDTEKSNIDNIGQHLAILAILALADILWSISFHEKYRKYLFQNIHLIKNLEEFRDSGIVEILLPFIHIPNQMSSLKRMIDGIWQNLSPSRFPIKFPLKSKPSRSLMISYSHLNINFCRELSQTLNKLPELTINVDINNGKYFWEEILLMMHESDIILFLLSKEFYYSKSCRQEFLYVTDRLKKLFFPIFIDSNFKASGWLQPRIVRLKSIRFGEKDFFTSCEEILSLINENLSTNLSLRENSSEIKKWNEEDIKQWFMNEKILPELYEFYQFKNGNELLLYTQAILAFPWTKEYERIQLRFEEKYKQQEKTLSQEQFLEFIYALKRLPK